MAYRRHGGGRGRPDDGKIVIIEDQYGKIIDLSVPRPAGEPRPGPFHQIMFEAMGGPHRCYTPDLGCHNGGGCEARMRVGILRMAADNGYQGPPDPRQVRQFWVTRHEDLLEGFLAWAAPSRVIPPGGGEPLGGPGFTRTTGVETDGGGRDGRERAHGHPRERQHGGGGGGGGGLGRAQGHPGERRHHGGGGGGGGGRAQGHPGERRHHGGGGGHGPSGRHGGGGHGHSMGHGF